MVKRPADDQQSGMASQGNYTGNSAANANMQDISILTARIQSFLNSGGQALAIAEAKTDQVAKMQAGSAEYKRMVEEVKAFQARAGYDFRQAEALLATANSLLPKKNDD